MENEGEKALRKSAAHCLRQAALAAFVLLTAALALCALTMTARNEVGDNIMLQTVTLVREPLLRSLLLSLAALAFALGLFLLYLLAPRLSLRKAGFYGTAVAAALFVLTTWFAAGERREMLDDSQAVVMAASTAVKSSPDKSATDLFVLHEGTLVKISDRLEGGCEITIADGKKGWLECRTIERI